MVVVLFSWFLLCGVWGVLSEESTPLRISVLLSLSQTYGGQYRGTLHGILFYLRFLTTAYACLVYVGTSRVTNTDHQLAMLNTPASSSGTRSALTLIVHMRCDRTKMDASITLLIGFKLSG